MRTLWIGIMTAAFAAYALGANFSGRWALQSGGRGGPTILTLNQVGNQVTGTLGARGNVGSGSPVGSEVMFGKAEGDTLTFYIWVGGDEPVKQNYKGTMSPSGDEITFTITGGAARGGGAGQGRGAAGPPAPVVAKRTN